MRIALDGMGGDKAPVVEVAGAIDAARDLRGCEIILVGDEDALKNEPSKYKPCPANITIRHATEVVTMSDAATSPIRRKKDSSISVCVDMVKNKEADAMVSAGNTGAVVCAAVYTLGLLPGVERPGIAIVFPTLKGPAMILDVGANIDPKPNHLLQYGLMADAYAKRILGKPNPTIGLLNVGEEVTKGTDFVKETHKLLSESRVNFIGNVEGRDIYAGKSDVIVCDGFVGNVVLKVSESVAFTMFEFLKRELKGSFMARLGVFLGKSAFKAFRKKMDYAEYGGAPLLGINGVVIISHGSSNQKAIKNAIRVASEFKDRGVNEEILQEIEKWRR
ncbi:MAG: phosphate acyltransferase PlsX [Candidatus Omnitrophica bacterium]|nr:phosphate acyltransferase PlsX [Candidatus Omnitrophota bacterium]